MLASTLCYCGLQVKYIDAIQTCHFIKNVNITNWHLSSVGLATNMIHNTEHVH